MNIFMYLRIFSWYILHVSFHRTKLHNNYIYFHFYYLNINKKIKLPLLHGLLNLGKMCINKELYIPYSINILTRFLIYKICLVSYTLWTIITPIKPGYKRICQCDLFISCLLVLKRIKKENILHMDSYFGKDKIIVIKKWFSSVYWIFYGILTFCIVNPDVQDYLNTQKWKFLKLYCIKSVCRPFWIMRNTQKLVFIDQVNLSAFLRY